MPVKCRLPEYGEDAVRLALGLATWCPDPPAASASRRLSVCCHSTAGVEPGMFPRAPSPGLADVARTICQLLAVLERAGRQHERRAASTTAKASKTDHHPAEPPPVQPRQAALVLRAEKLLRCRMSIRQRAGWSERSAPIDGMQPRIRISLPHTTGRPARPARGERNDDDLPRRQRPWRPPGPSGHTTSASP